MRFGSFVFVSLFLGLFVVPREAAAAEAPEHAASDDGTPAAPSGPVEQPEDWIAVAGIACYTVIPILLVITLGVLTYRWIEQGQTSLLLPAERNAWMWRTTAIARPPPEGLVLFRF